MAYPPGRLDHGDERTAARRRCADGLLGYYAGVSPEGSIVHVSVWDSDEHAAQMSQLKEMIVDARAELAAAGVTFPPIVNHPIAWTA